MKILHIIPTLKKGGAERLVLDIVKAIHSLGEHEVFLVVLKNEIDYPIQELEDIIRLIPSSVQLSLKGKNTKNIIELNTFIQNFQPDIIHTHLFEAELVSRSIDYPKAKWFSHCHDNMLQFKKLKEYKSPSKAALANSYEKKYLFKRYQKNRGTNFIAISNDAYTYFKPRIKNYPITLLHNAIDFNHFYKPLNAQQKDYEKHEHGRTNAQKTINEEQTTKNKQQTSNEEQRTLALSEVEGKNEQIRLINVGSFVPKKNQKFLIEVIKSLIEKGYKVHLDFLGDGPLRNDLQEMVKKEDLTKFITFHGNVNNVADYLHQATVYVHSAYYEPLGLVLLEAMAAGLPVVCLDGKGNRDLIREGENGFMVEQEDVDLFVTRILELSEYKAQYDQMARNAQDFAKGFDIKEYVDRLLDVYRA